MANCCICGKKIGMFDGNPLSMFEREWSSYMVCPKCGEEIQKLRNGDFDAYIHRNIFIKSIKDEKIKNYIISVIKEPDKEKLDIYYKQLQNEQIQEKERKHYKNSNVKEAN